MTNNHIVENGEHERLPIVGTWRWLYFIVILNLAFCILLFYLFSEAFK